MTTSKLIKGLLGASALTVLSTGTAFAAGTAAGTNVQNTFTLDYQVGGVDQTTIDNTGTPTEFTVDRLIDLTVAAPADLPVAPGAQDQDLVFSLTNDGNDTQAYALTTANVAGDDFDPSGVTLYYVVDDGNGIYEPGIDPAPIAYNGTNTPDVAPDATLFVIVEGDIGAGVTDGQTATVSLVADTLDAGTTTPSVADPDGTNTLTGGAENVLADANGTDDLANEGDHSARGTYVVASATIAAAKTVSIYRQDGSACATIPGTAPATEQYSVPGACVEYRIAVDNTGGTAATDIVVNDILATDFTFVAADVVGNFTGGTFSTPALPANGADCNAVTCEVNFEGASLAAGQSGEVVIRVLLK